MLKKAINLLKTIAVTNNAQDILVILEGTPNTSMLIKLLNLTFDNQCPWQIVNYSEFQTKKGRNRKPFNSLGKYLKDNPKKFIVLARIDESIFVAGQSDIRPLKYLEEDELI